MRRIGQDEFSFDSSREEIGTVSEYARSAAEDAIPPDLRETAPEFNGDTGSLREETKNRAERHARVKRMLMAPLASTLAVVSLVFASFAADPLGSDFLVSGSIFSSSAASPAPTPAPTPSAAPATDAFPSSPNLDPDFSGAYAWAGLGSEEYLVVDSQYLHAGTYYTNGGVSLVSPAGASYDKTTNTLTLNNYHGGFIDANLMGNGFKIRLIGGNSLDYIKLWGAMYGGSVTFTGTGSITLNKNGTAPSGVGLYLACEYSPSCVMIDREATVEVYGTYAVIIESTTLEKAIYTLSPITITGGECASGAFVAHTVPLTDESGNVIFDEDGMPVTEVITVKEIAEDKGMALYDYSVVGSDGLPSSYVKFAP